MIPRIRCSHCKKAFWRSESRIQEGIKRHWNFYCSDTCKHESKLRGKILVCSRPGCEKTFYRTFKEAGRVMKCYCSQSCAAIVNNENKPKRIRKLKKCGIASCNQMIPLRMTHCSKKCRAIAMTVFTDKELLKKVKELSQKLNRAPAKREMGKVAYMCIRAFGSWNNTLKKVGLEPHRSHSQRMYKRTNTVALDGHKCDSISEAIIDNWLTKHKILHSRNVPYPTTGHKADWGIGNKILVEYFGLANDSLRYDRSIREKRALCRNNGIRLVEIYPRDLYPEVQLENKFPKNLTSYQLT